MGENDDKVLSIKKMLKSDENAKEVFSPTLMKNLWTNIMKGSVVQQLAGSIPMALNGTAVSMPVGQPIAGVVDEGGVKPVGTLSTAVKVVRPIKLALMILYTEELAIADPLGEYARIQAQLAEGIARAIDVAVIHGKDATNGQAITGVESLLQTTKSVTIPTAPGKPGDLFKLFFEAYNKVVIPEDDQEAEYGFTHLLASQKIKSKLALESDGFGRPLYQDSMNVNNSFSTVMGVPTTYSRAVSGYGQATDAKALAIGGDFKDNLRLGFAQKITFRRASERAGGIDLFDTNMRAILAECHVGWVIRDLNAFAKIVAE